MENLITCSRVLYDKDISDKMKEITSLKRNLRFYETPKIEYSNLEEWENKKKEAFQIIKNGLNKDAEDIFESGHTSAWGLKHSSIQYYIEKALNLITKENNKEWVEMTSNNINYGIEGFYNGFNTDNWNLIYSQLGSETMSNIIYNNIIWQLDDADGDLCILEDIAIFTCVICGKKDTYHHNDKCYDCDDNYKGV